MNKLVIVGNGFDLAHQLPTSYKSFINYIWSNLVKSYDRPEFNCLVVLKDGLREQIEFECQNYNEFRSSIKSVLPKDFYFKENGRGYKSFRIIFNNMVDRQDISFEFKNKFFEYITVQLDIENWVDIENCYYSMLIDLANNKKLFNINSVKQLNEEFGQIKDLLKYYLKNEIEPKIKGRYKFIANENLINIFAYKYINLAGNNNHPYFLEFNPDLREDLVKFDSIFNEIGNDRIKYHEIMFLNFNYTSNVTNYVVAINSFDYYEFGTAHEIQIHGDLYKENNKINFGFGDEMDDNYKMLENKNDNEYLENIKSFQYLQNSNYKKLLNWVEANNFQVFILGHSCGLSDRTLLNTIFEHHNCKSIKIFYHKHNTGDNYKEIVQNISRHFNKKALMRSKLVDYSLCVPLPQNVNYDD